MALPPTFPQLAGQGWSVHKRPSFSTRIASHVSGREVREALYAVSLYEFELTFDALASSGAGPYGTVGATSLQTLLGFVLQCQGQFGTFLYVDPTDNAVVGQQIGVGDGVTTTFTLVRTIGGFIEPASYVTQVNAVTVAGAATANWSLATPNILTFAVAPAAGAIVGASFAYAFLCRFLDDTQDFENVMSGLWRVATLKFRSVRS